MDWFAMSSKFYLDLDDEGVSEAAQTLLARALGYMADNETSGFLAKSALKKLGLPRVSRRLDELVLAKIMVERVDGSGYDFPAWYKWQEPLERLVRKRKRDRETVAEKRRQEQNVVRQSHDVVATQGQEQLPIPSTNCVEVSPVSIAPEQILPDGSPVGWCVRHPGGTAARCRPCGDARRAKEAWDAERVAAAKVARSSEAHGFAHARALAIADCGLCDADGQIGTIVCDHDPNTPERASRGMSLIRQEMGWEA